MDAFVENLTHKTFTVGHSVERDHTEQSVSIPTASRPRVAYFGTMPILRKARE
jgi:hypothetical protein